MKYIYELYKNKPSIVETRPKIKYIRKQSDDYMHTTKQTAVKSKQQTNSIISYHYYIQRTDSIIYLSFKS